MLDSPTLPVSHNRMQMNNDAFEDSVVERPVRRSSLLHDGRAQVEREVLAQGPTNLRRQPTRRRMKSSGSIASLMSITFGTDGADAGSADDLPMFRVIPATPVGGTDAFEARPRSADETELATLFKAKPRQLDHAVELEVKSLGQNDIAMGLAESAFPPLPTVKPLALRSGPPKMAMRSSSSDGRLEHDTSFSSGSAQSPSLTSLTTASSSMSLDTLEDDEKVFQSILAGFDDVRLEDTAPYRSHDHVDPLRQIKAELDEEIRSWSSMSLESHDEGPDGGDYYGQAMHGLGFDMHDDRSTTPINRIQPLRSKTEVPTMIHKPATPEDETTPRPDRSSSGFPDTGKLWQDKRISETSAGSSDMSSFDSSDSMTDTDLDSLMSDIDDLHSASITVVASKTSAQYASPRQVEFRDQFRHEQVPEEGVKEEDDSAARWENADEDDEMEIGWAM